MIVEKNRGLVWGLVWGLFWGLGVLDDRGLLPVDCAWIDIPEATTIAIIAKIKNFIRLIIIWF